MKLCALVRPCVAPLLVTLLTACGGGGSGTPSSAAPEISNLSVTPAAVYASATPQSFEASFDFHDLQGDIATLTLSIKNGSGTILDLGTQSISDIAGMTSGTIIGELMASAVNPDIYTVMVHVTDATHLSSNVLSRQVRIAAYPWTAQATDPIRRENAASAVLDGKLYVAGGQLTDSGLTPGPATAMLEVYDPVTNTWSTAQAMPTARMGLTLTAYNGKLYAMGGRTDGYSTSAVGTVEEYNPTTDAWITKAPMQTPRYFAAAAATASPVGNLIVVAGGEALDTVLDRVEAYNPATNAWIGRAALPAPRSRLAMTAGTDGQLYAVGGYAGVVGQWRGELTRYDPLLDTWTLRATMPTARAHLAWAEVNGRLLAAGGENVDRSLTVLESYDPTSNVWSSKTSSIPAFTRSTAGVVAGRMYVIGDALTLQYDPANDIR